MFDWGLNKIILLRFVLHLDQKGSLTTIFALEFQTLLHIRRLVDWTLSKSQLETFEKKNEVNAYQKFKNEREQKLASYT